MTEITTMNPNDKTATPPVWHSILNVVGGIAGILTCLAVFVWGGEYKRQVDVNTADITRIQRDGSPTLQSHERLDDNRVAELNRRVTRMEDTVIDFGMIKTTVAVIDDRQKLMTAQLQTIQDQVTAMSKLVKP